MANANTAIVSQGDALTKSVLLVIASMGIVREANANIVTAAVGIANMALVREGDAPTRIALAVIAHTEAVLMAPARMVHAAAATVKEAAQPPPTTVLLE